MKIALIHDWLTGMRGGEKVLEDICRIYPQADIFTLLWNKGSVSNEIESHRITTSFLQRFPQVDKKYRYYLPFMPLAIQRLDVEQYDVIISSSHCVAKGVRKRKGAVHICYCHTPMRYIWDQYDEYFNNERTGMLPRRGMRLARPFLQKWDVESSRGVDVFIANSRYVAERIKRIYGRDSVVVYPPADTDFFVPSSSDEQNAGEYYLMVSALVPYKKVDLVIKAFSKTNERLKIIGSGPDTGRLKAMAAPNIEFLGWQPDETVRSHYQSCRAFLFPQEEDFGITAVEAQACGKPVIAYGKGGALETVIDGTTGVHFPEPTTESLLNALLRCKDMEFSSEVIRRNAERFSRSRFVKEISRIVSSAMSDHNLQIPSK